jgi:hypothetical protein
MLVAPLVGDFLVAIGLAGCVMFALGLMNKRTGNS